MKVLSFLTLAALLSISSCSHMGKSCCEKKEASSCAKPDCKQACCDKDKKCTDGSCSEEKKKEDCKGESCKKKA